jgi:arylsulfatase A-like enzyme
MNQLMNLCRVGLLLSSVGLSVFAATPPPHIILLMGDDHGWEETGYNGHPHVKTPVLDEMAATGLRLDNFYAGHPNCSPTRASFLTGRHPNRMGTFSPGWSIRPEEITLAHLLRKAGYRTAHFGKWHVGAVKASSPVNPGAMGFDEWLSHDNFFELNPSLSRQGAPPEVFPGESSAILIRETIDFIARSQASGRPSFTVVWFGSPHEPYHGLPGDLALYDDLPHQYAHKKVKLTSLETGTATQRPKGEVLRERFAEITAMDRSIGTLRDYLADSGLKANTLLFYCGDNGTSADGAIYHPHRGVKGAVYDGGILVPGLIEWPARIPRPRHTTIRASTSDLLPTLCGLTGQPLPNRPVDGVDLTGVIDGTMAERANPLYFWSYANRARDDTHRTPYLAPELQQGTTPLVKLMDGIKTHNFKNLRFDHIIEADFRGPRAIIEGDLKLVIHDQKNGEETAELFDLSRDPAETTDLITQRPAAATALRQALRHWQSSVLQSLTGADY